MEEINMTGMTMSPIFGIFFALVGLALAVVLGLVLYRDKKQENVSRKESFKIQNKHEAVRERYSLICSFAKHRSYVLNP
jgi:hypothetical protein